jgi:hypothetical protein
MRTGSVMLIVVESTEDKVRVEDLAALGQLRCGAMRCLVAGRWLLGRYADSS